MKTTKNKTVSDTYVDRKVSLESEINTDIVFRLHKATKLQLGKIVSLLGDTRFMRVLDGYTLADILPTLNGCNLKFEGFSTDDELTYTVPEMFLDDKIEILSAIERVLTIKNK